MGGLTMLGKGRTVWHCKYLVQSQGGQYPDVKRSQTIWFGVYQNELREQQWDFIDRASSFDCKLNLRASLWNVLWLNTARSVSQSERLCNDIFDKLLLKEFDFFKCGCLKTAKQCKYINGGVTCIWDTHRLRFEQGRHGMLILANR